MVHQFDTTLWPNSGSIIRTWTSPKSNEPKHNRVIYVSQWSCFYGNPLAPTQGYELILSSSCSLTIFKTFCTYICNKNKHEIWLMIIKLSIRIFSDCFIKFYACRILTIQLSKSQKPNQSLDVISNRAIKLLYRSNIVIISPSVYLSQKILYTPYW